MLRGFLIEEGSGDESRQVPIGSEFLLGRTRDCNFILEDTAASRHHMEIHHRNGGYFWRDLDSTNGVLVNDTPMLEGQLDDGDRIRIGSTELRFRMLEAESDPDPVVMPEERRSETIVSEWRPSGFTGVPEGNNESHVLFEALHTVMNNISSNYEQCSLVDKVLQTTMEAIDAQRGAIFFSTGEQSDLSPCPVCDHIHSIQNGKLVHSKQNDIHISQTVVRRVLDDGESLLIQDTGQDMELNAADSIMALNLRSIICVPVRGKFGVLGILYIDSDRPQQAYTQEHMLLSTAVGNSAGLAMENAEMHDEILKNQRVEQELEFAGIIQDGFLVHSWPEEDSRFSVYGDARPAKTVGGDFYDMVQPDADRVVVLIGDVSGKGVPASLSMAQILAEFRVLTTKFDDPLSIVTSLNESLEQRSQRGMFCTLCCGMLDLKTGRFQCVNAGHHGILSGNRMGVETFGNSTGPPLGILTESTWSIEETIVRPGDSLLFCTDGILEARNTADQKRMELREYGQDSLEQLLKNFIAESPQIIVEEILRDVLRFCEPEQPHDDCTLLVLRFSGN